MGRRLFLRVRSGAPLQRDHLTHRLQPAVTVERHHRHCAAAIVGDHQEPLGWIEGGAFGPALEAQLKPHGLTLRHFPQSFEYSTLGGWIEMTWTPYFSPPTGTGETTPSMERSNTRFSCEKRLPTEPK